jgi:glucose-6-phosphate 1-dehydrogenase
MSKQETFKPCDLVIYGALGDLSTRKLIISLYRLEKAGLLEDETQIIGVDLHEKEDKAFVKVAQSSLKKFLKEEIDKTVWSKFSARLCYLQIDLTQMDQYKKLNDVVDSSQKILVNYFSVAPFLFTHICQGLAHSGVLTDESRVVVEKPLGHDLKSSQEINNAFSDVFNENQIYRIDHYLGK